ncbi:peptidase inhibitor family I36 protein [Streptomyces sp. NPDC057654]|uniref:peptidase inhibitor family I36 protein n=1 Tax=Streptomyces sp. NPDC057654 TaxID=3346196 RepID=UPI0036746B22
MKIAAVAAGTLGVFALSIGPAMAEAYVKPGQGAGACPSGYVCLYDNLNLNQDDPGDVLVTNESLADLHPYHFGDRASSYVNKTGHYVVFYDHGDYQGGQQFVASGTSGNMPGSMGDDVSSLKILP